MVYQGLYSQQAYVAVAPHRRWVFSRWRRLEMVNLLTKVSTASRHIIVTVMKMIICGADRVGGRTTIELKNQSTLLPPTVCDATQAEQWCSYQFYGQN